MYFKKAESFKTIKTTADIPVRTFSSDTITITFASTYDSYLFIEFDVLYQFGSVQFVKIHAKYFVHKCGSKK